jgi:hypothetical integral membrane protein (TIGR02206 family)
VGERGCKIWGHPLQYPILRIKVASVDQFFAKDYTGGAFVLFGTYHIIALAVVALVIIWIVQVGQRGSERTRMTIRHTLAAVLVLDELGWHLWNALTGQWTIQTMLPLHLCSVLVWLSAYMLVTRNYRVYESAYLLGIAGALQALLTPDAGKYGFPHYRSIQVILSHGSIIAAAVYMTLVEKFRPTWASVRRVLIGGNIYMLAVFVLNFAIGSNYLFIAHKPETASLLDVLPPWPWYLIIIELLGLVFAFLLYSPYAIGDWWKGWRKSNN